jgi:hypothetical protein
MIISVGGSNSLENNEIAHFFNFRPNFSKLYNGIFSVFLVAVIMAIFELIFFVSIVSYTVKLSIKSLLDYTVCEVHSVEQMTAVIDVLNEREYKLISDVNTGSYLFIVMEIVLFMILLIYLSKKTKIVRSSYSSAALTISFLIGFQIVFYFYGRAYIYLFIDEIMVLIIDNL